MLEARVLGTNSSAEFSSKSVTSACGLRLVTEGRVLGLSVRLSVSVYVCLQFWYAHSFGRALS